MTLNLDKIDDQQLLKNTEALVKQERSITIFLLAHLDEIESRRLYAELGHSSLFSYCIKKLGYSESEAYLRIAVMRLSRSLPEIKEWISTGDITISNVVITIQSIKRQEKISGENLALEEKRALLAAVSKKSTRAAKQLLEAIEDKKRADQQAKSAPPLSLLMPPAADELTPYTTTTTATTITTTSELIFSGVSGGNSGNSGSCGSGAPAADEILPPWSKAVLLYKVEVSSAVLEKMATLKNLAGNYSDCELLELALQKTIESYTKPSVNQHRQNHTLTPSPQNNHSRYIPQSVRQEVRARAKDRCEYISPITGERCEEVHNLEFDHCQPFAGGGENNVTNLRLYCRTHNLLVAKNTLGKEKMDQYWHVKN
ncbi:MAG: HNH endonuclease [Oligoflexia bacterium]|nr:HNH endonuclease [Oligoflexia bacterium]